MKRLLTISIALGLTFGIGLVAEADAQNSSGDKAGNATESALDTVGEGAKKGMKSAGKGRQRP